MPPQCHVTMDSPDQDRLIPATGERKRRSKPKDRPRDPLLLEDFEPRESGGCCTALSLFGDAAYRMPIMGKVWLALKLISSVGQVEVIVWCTMTLLPAFQQLFLPDASGELKSEDARTAEYYKLLGLFSISVVLYGLGRSLMVYALEAIRLHFRTYLTKKLMSRYFSINNYYHLASQPTIDNPGMRICDDVDAYTENVVFLLDEQVARVYMIIRLGLSMFFKHPRLMLLFTYYGPCLVPLLLVTPMFIRAVKRVIASNAIFREGMTQVQEYGENIAFCEAGEHEEHWALSQFHRVVSDLWSYAHRLNIVDTILNTGTWVGDIIPFAILASVYLVKPDDYKNIKGASGLLGSARDANVLLMKCLFTFFKDGSIQKLGNIFGPVKRIKELMDFFDHHERVIRTQKARVAYGAKSLTLNKVSVVAPGGRKLVQNLDFKVAPGDSVLISGPSGVGKSSLMRVICGLWAPEKGSISLP